MPSAKLQNTTKSSKPKPRDNNQTNRNWPTSKSSCITVPVAEHSRNSGSFSDSKHFVFSTCQKCVFNANHDGCITKFLNEVNFRAKVQSHKTRNSNKPVEPKSHTQKPGRHIVIEQRFSPNKSSAVHEKPNTLRFCLRWKPTGKIFKIAGLRWIPTGKMFTDITTKVDSEPPNDSNEDIIKPYKCEQTLNVNAGLITNPPSLTPYVPPINNDWDIFVPTMFDAFLNSPPVCFSVRAGCCSVRLIPKHSHFHDDLLHETIHEESTSQGSSLNVRPYHTPLDLLGKWTKNHPLANVFGILLDQSSQESNLRLMLCGVILMPFSLQLNEEF
ncbi:hypothetical protein Tco_0593665 [Tanacetum coccineum]